MKEAYEKNWNLLMGAHQQGKLAHALLFCGAAGTGKFEFAVQLAKEVGGFGDKIEDLLTGQHPDLFVIEPQMEEKKKKIREKEISIRQLKESLEKSKFFPYQVRCKFFIVRKADKMTVGAANSILKVIEEPGSDLRIILTAEHEDAVLSTIKSRCQIVRFGLLDKERIINYLERIFQNKKSELALGPKVIASAVEISRGRIKLAEEMVLNKELLSETQEAIDYFRSSLRGGVYAGFKLSEKLSDDKKKLLEVLDQWIWYLESFMKKLVKEKSDSRVLQKVLEMVKELIGIKVAVSHSNVSERLLLENFFVKINW